MTNLTAYPRRLWLNTAITAWVLLIVLTVLWEGWLAPAERVPPGFWLILKSLPLLAPLFGLLRGRPRTFGWASLLVPVYLTEGLVIAVSQRHEGLGLHGPVLYAWIEIGLSLAFVVAAAGYLRAGNR